MRNADLDDVKDEQCREKVAQERKEVDAVPKQSQTTNDNPKSWRDYNDLHAKIYGELVRLGSPHHEADFLADLKVRVTRLEDEHYER